MGYIDWTLLASHNGESIEDFIAVLLRRKHRDALQVNPSQGDKGIDVYRDTPGGLVNWQVKKFTTPPSASQWRQIQKSWRRFVREQVDKGVKVASYTLVTPWTPTAERRKDFADLTAGAGFPTQWDGDSFITGLTDEFPESLARFVKGRNVLDSLVNEKALLASSPVEKADSVTMVEAITMRQSKLNEIRDLVSDHYLIDSGTRTMAKEGEWPLPSPDDVGVMHRYTYLGNNRFAYDTVVPRTPQSVQDDPIKLQIEFQVEDGSAEASSITDWRDWGIPFTDIPAKMSQTGGPFGDRNNDDAVLSFKPSPSSKPHPNMRFRIVRADGTEKNSIPLRVTEVTQGVSTGWLRILAESPQGVLGMEIRLGDANATTSTLTLDRVEGKTPQGVLSEMSVFETMDKSDVIVLAVDGAGDVVSSGKFVMSEAMKYMGRVADALLRLQPSANTQYLMPDTGVTVGQLRELEALADLYEGNALTRTWEKVSFTARANNDELVKVVESGHVIVEVNVPLVHLGNSEYVIDRPMAQSRRSIRFENIPEGGFVEGETYRLVPDGDNSLVIAAVTDWKQGDPPFDLDAANTERSLPLGKLG